MNQTLVTLVAALVGATCLSALAQTATPPAAKAAAAVASAPGTGTIISAVSISARVESIDPATRQLTLKGPKGKLQTVTAGPDVRNFEQIKVGDMVVARYVESLTLTLKKDGKELVSRVESSDAARAQTGDKPAGIVGRQVEVTANVVAVDAKTQTLTLKGPKQTVQLKVPDPKQFKMVKVGDQIQGTYTEAVALSIETAKAAVPQAPAKK
jgi:ribosomal protein L6P/L9E